MEHIDPLTLQRARRFAQLTALKEQLRKVITHKERLEQQIEVIEEQVRQDIQEALGEG